MIDQLQNQITGLEAKLQDLRDAEKIFIKAQGLDEEAQKARAEAGELSDDIQGIKEELGELKGQKAQALQGTAQALADAMSKVLPDGIGIFEISDEGSVWIGWEKPGGVRVPYRGLSGGQKVAFDQALSFALLGDGHKVLILEAAELDPIHLQQTLAHLAHNSGPDVQIIVNTWMAPADVPVGWELQVVE